MMQHRVIETRTGELPPFPDAAALEGVGLRREEAGDRQFLRNLYGAQRAAELLLVPWTEAEKVRFLDEQFRLQMLHFDREMMADRLVILQAEAPIGRLYIDRSAGEWRLLEIALTPAAQGRGVGTALIAWLHAAGAAAGAEAITLHVGIDNARAEALYRRLGYAEVASEWQTHRRLRHALAG